MQGYYQHPTVYEDQLVFVCEDDLWLVGLEGGLAQRLTASPGRCRSPHFSPDGGSLAYTGRDEGPNEVYLLELSGGEPRRLTFLGCELQVVGFSPDGAWIYFTSNHGQPFSEISALARVPAAGGAVEKLPWGPSASISFESGGPGRVLGRHTWDTARWKRYRGGTVGQFWIDRQGDGDWQALRPGGGNLTSPLWIGRRLFFGSDHEGHGNLYSCSLDGDSLTQHTDHSDFYVRRPCSDGKTLVYQCGAELYHYHLERGRPRKIDIRLRAAGFKRQRKFTAGGEYLDHYSLHPEGKALAFTVRGKALSGSPHDGPVTQYGQLQGVRYRLLSWLDSQQLVCTSDEGGEERLEIYERGGKRIKRLKRALGRPLKLAVCPTGPWLAVTNHRYELWLVNWKTERSELIEQNSYGRLPGLSWSPCGRYLAYSSPTGRMTTRLRLLARESRELSDLTEGCFRDVGPHFDPLGRYLYFLSLREFNPVWDNLFFEMSFPLGMRPYLLTLNDRLPDPFEPGACLPETREGPIQTEGAANRIVAFPMREDRYGQVLACEDSVWLTRLPGLNESDGGATLVRCHLRKQEVEDVYEEVSNFTLSADGKWLCYRSDDRLRLVSSQTKPESNDKTPGRKSGWLSGRRLRVSIEPRAEWQQMAGEAWRLMREHFWDASLPARAWQDIFARYRPLLARVGCRSELSDWMWELQGELGTSHAYESGGDYPAQPYYAVGKLGLELRWDLKRKGYLVERVLRGDGWDRVGRAPGRRPGQTVQVGDLLTHLQGVELSQDRAAEAQLVFQAGQEVTVRLRRGRKRLELCLKTLSDELELRYRDWVEANRDYVHKISQGRLGYLHVPNMGPAGFAEFHRGYFSEVQRQGLVVDVRFNGGGSVSGLLLEKLSRRIVGWDVPRYGEPVAYPLEAPQGPLVAITNEMAGSDGDIFSHSFKLLKLGPLVGTRTWGGVIGVWPRHKLVDGTQTTQPEFAFWFEDVGWRLENYGTEPDLTVDIRPQDWAAGRDAQLEKAVEVGLERLNQRPARPAFKISN